MSRVFRFRNGIHEIRKGSVLEFPEDRTRVVVCSFEPGMTILRYDGESVPELWFDREAVEDCTFIQ